MVETTSLKEPASETFDTITNSATTPKLTRVDVSSTGGHESGPPTLASSDDGVSASQGLPTSRVLQIDCPISSRTRSKVKQHQSDQDLGDDSTTVLPTNPVSNASLPSVEPKNILELAWTHFISKLSFDCCYFFATAKAEVKVSGSDSTRMYQFRDLSLQ